MRTKLVLPVLFATICVLAVLFLSGSSTALSPEAGDVRGSITFQDTEENVTGALVTISNANGSVNGSYTTSTDGVFLFPDILPGEYTIHAIWEDQERTEIIFVPANETMVINLYFNGLESPGDAAEDDDDGGYDDDDNAMGTDEDSSQDGGPIGGLPIGAGLLCGIAAIVLIGAVVVIVGILIAYNYSKISSTKMMAHGTRVKIYDHISKNPGNHLRKIKRDLKLPMGVLTHHITMMEREELIKYRLDGQYKRYFPWDHKIEKKEWLSDMQNHIVKTVQENPGISPNKISKQLKISRNNAYYHTAQLETMGIILIDKSGKAHKCFMKIDT